MSMVADPRLISPKRRRIVDAVTIGADAAKQLVTLGWKPYDGPAQVVEGRDEHATQTVFERLGVYLKGDALTGTLHPGTRNGWIIPGTDPKVDRERLEITGMATLGDGVHG